MSTTPRCHDCAFTIGTEASKGPHTAVVARLCAMTGERFDCHVREGACAGWAQEVAERKATGALLAPGSEAYKVAQLGSELMQSMVELVARERGAA